MGNFYDYRISNGTSSVISGTGTISFTFGFKAFAGSGTAFLTQLHRGDLIIVGGLVVGSVDTISDNVNGALTYVSGSSIVLQAFTIDPLVNVETLVSPASPPKGDYQPWGVSMPTGDALARGLGRPLAQWRWNMGPADYLSDALRDALRTYCTGKSARVYIRTRTFESGDAFGTFQAAMIWPDKEDRDWKGIRKGFVIEFRDLIVL